uniref:Uncharacterized protein n=1 Tax=Heterorhabditis bacteriophora TaxID=37862 RepID=A0A1I7XB55_HETBA
MVIEELFDRLVSVSFIGRLSRPTRLFPSSRLHLFFKTSSEVKKESVMSNSIESFSEINELILSPQLTSKPNITGASKSSKSFAAPAPPSSTQNINKEVKENCDAIPVEMLGEKSVGNCPDKPATIKDEDYWNDRQDKGNAVQSAKTMQKNLQSITILKKEHQSELSLQVCKQF